MIFTNSEFVLAVIIDESIEISGYQINKLIKERGYIEWAGVGTTSIYNGLKKMEKNGYVKKYLDTNKTTKGAIGKIYSLTKSGKEILLDEIKLGLSETRECNSRFKIALSRVNILENDEILTLFKKRVKFLKSEISRLEKKRDKHKDLSKHIIWLFTQPLMAIKNEIDFMNYLINTIKIL